MYIVYCFFFFWGGGSKLYSPLENNYELYVFLINFVTFGQFLPKNFQR